ncbi:MAG: DUF2298 domain-containing protein [Chloroflexota bacterium]
MDNAWLPPMGTPSPGGGTRPTGTEKRGWESLASIALLLAILAAAAWLRFRGINWDESQHLHPDERFLTMVETSIRFPDSLGQYFDTATSPLNPNNVGHGFFVYGTLPIFFVRLVAEWTGNAGYDPVTLVGRAASAAFDLLSIVLLYLVGKRLYSRRVGLLAAVLAAFTVLFIQHAHFFVVESFTNAFILAGFYFAIGAFRDGRWREYLLFGLFLGLATASKISAAPLAAVVVLAGVGRLWVIPPADRQRESSRLLLQLLASAAVSVLVFRVFQPYAFAGPTFFGVRLNPQWLANMAELRRQAGGQVDFPPALQWANRTPILFALSNMVIWGMGIPLGLASWLGWAWALVRMLRGEWQRHLLLVTWTGAFFLWQSTTFTPSMRYQMPVYPTLILLAAWALWELWDRAGVAGRRRRVLRRATAGLAGAIVLLGTAAWGVAFAGIYARPMPRVQATRWIYSHLPGAVNLVVEVDGEKLLDPIVVPMGLRLTEGTPYVTSFINSYDGTALAVLLPYVADLAPQLGPKTLHLQLQESPDPTSTIATIHYTGDLPTAGETALELPLDVPAGVYPGHTYYLQLELLTQGAVGLRGPIGLRLTTAGGDQTQTIGLPQESLEVAAGAPFSVSFTAHQDGTARAVLLQHAADLSFATGPRSLRVVLKEETETGPQILATGVFQGDLAFPSETEVEIRLDRSVAVRSGGYCTLELEVADVGAIGLRASVVVNESTWDDGLPLRLDGRDAGGLYNPLLLELYWPDDLDQDQNGAADKLERLVDQLNQADLLVISSNRQYGTIPRVPIRYPLTAEYYRALFDCPAPQDVRVCVDRAQPGQLHSPLGFDLVQVFVNNPRLGPVEISDQLAEEAFTVYDHPKVLIFARSPDYSEDRVRAILGAVDLSQVVPVLPSEAGNVPPNLMLPPDRLAEERAGGTWLELYPRQSLVNRSELAAVIAWWLLIALFGVLALPLTRAAFPGLHDGGYPLARLVGLLVVAWGAWMLGSLRLPFGRLSIAAVLIAMALVSGLLAWKDRESIGEFLLRKRREIAWTEALALALFLLDLAIRLGNPDLWHPSKGGEKPMDLSYLNAVLKSTSFPPYDPWFSGGFINYYYYGFVLVGVPIRLLGLNPSVAYNLILPTLFALLGLSAYCVGFNLVFRWKQGRGLTRPSLATPRTAGLAAALAIVLLGNLGTVRMLYEGFKRIGGAEGGETRVFVAGLVDAARGALRLAMLQAQLPYGLDNWYWDPSRAIPPRGGEPGPITEFPFFTFLYADLHAHMISRPVAVLCLAWLLSWLLAAEERKQLPWWRAGLGLFIGGLAFGAIRPINLGDYPVYWGLAAAGAAIAPLLRDRKLTHKSLAASAISVLVLFAFIRGLYQPYYTWYGQAYGAVAPWKGSHTPISAYLTIHGLFLFVLVTWMAWESIEWMAATPLSSLHKLQPAFGPLVAAAIFLVVMVITAVGLGYVVALLVIPLMAWAGVLFLRPGQPLEKRLVLTLSAAALALTLLVEVVVIVGDVGRMNTVFKFYLQVWEMFGVAAAAALVWMLEAVTGWRPSWRKAWTGALAVLVVGAGLYPVAATMAKVRDRMSAEAPHSLDGMAYMTTSAHYDVGGSTSLVEDYQAIRWMQDNVRGSPVIVEANTPEYRWGSRFTIYTGLPGVLGWNWHQRQQRVLAGDFKVWDRYFDITDFYLTRSIEEAQAFLQRYQASYIIVGQLERMYYERFYPCLPDEDGFGVSCDVSGRLRRRDCEGVCPLEVSPAECTPLDASSPTAGLSCPTHGLDKFEIMAAQGLLREVYHVRATEIYEVVR